MGQRGIDLSEHQAGMDVESVARANQLDFAFVRTNYGANHDDAWFQSHADAAERAGALVVPYVYVLASDVRGSIDDALRVAGDRYGSLVVDWEEGSGGGDELRLAHELLWERGVSTPVVYAPRWYWERVGSPDLSWMQGRVQGHWKSWYADNQARTYDDALSRVPGYAWDDSRGGIPTVIVQFTGTGRLAGYGGNLDLNYFPGDRAALEALLAGGDDVPLDANRDYPAFLQMLQRAYAYDLRPGGAGADWKLGPTIFETFAALLNRSVADVDEEALATELAKRGVGDVDVTKIKAALTEVLSRTSLNVSE